ncbi:unnamed protein product [Penicillium olsonii]|uniref:RTA1-domain-containing protein n=1 Tax=Penicillium olsonii TaxID=99116 RepID=A0A9W4HXY3_PENOL|nr:unnamed protein product [Penicillium olsonii]
MSNVHQVLNKTQQAELHRGCHPYHPGWQTAYGYVPSEAAGIVFCALFGASLLVHVVQFSWKRMWWLCVFPVGSLVELIGWAGRTWSSKCVYNQNAFLMQISTLIIAPTFFTAGIYILLGRFISIFGRQSSVLSPKAYLWIFCTCDIISLVVQAVGGGLASSAFAREGGNTDPGSNTMVGGVIFQLASITVFVICAADFLRRVSKMGVLRTASVSFILLMLAMVISVLCIYVRSIYRTIELLQGWRGYLITHELYFIVLDGAMMVVASAIFNVVSPAFLLDSVKVATLQDDRSATELTEPKPEYERESSSWI